MVDGDLEIAIERTEDDEGKKRASRPKAPRSANAPTEAAAALKAIPEIDKILRPFLHAGWREIHSAVGTILEDWPGRKRDEVWRLLRQLRDDRGEARGCHVVWTEEDVSLLRARYGEGRTGARRATKELLKLHPAWHRRAIWYMARKLALATHSFHGRRWTDKDQGYLLWWAGEKPVKWLATKLQRSEAAIRQRLSMNCASGRVRIASRYSERQAARQLGVSHTSLRAWIAQGILAADPVKGSRNRGNSGKAPVRFSEATLTGFCQRHPGRVNKTACSPLALEWINEGKRAEVWSPTRSHLAHSRSCPHCGRAVRGNGYFTHEKACANRSYASRSNT